MANHLLATLKFTTLLPSSAEIKHQNTEKIFMNMVFPRMFFLILIQFFILHTVSESSWQTLSG